MRKFLAVALAVLMLLALMPTASAAKAGDVYSVQVNYVKSNRTVAPQGSYTNGAIKVELPLGDIYDWNIPGYTLNTAVNTGSSWGKFLQMTTQLAVEKTYTEITQATATVSTADKDAKNVDGLLFTTTITDARPAIDSAKDVYYINGNLLRAYYAESAPTYSYAGSEDDWIVQQTIEYTKVIDYVFYFDVSNGSTRYAMSVVAQKQSAFAQTFYFDIDYVNTTANNVNSTMAVATTGTNADNMRAYISGGILYIDSVWQQLKPEYDTKYWNDGAGTTVNENYGNLQGYYSTDLTFYMKDAAGNPLSQYTVINSMTYDGVDIIAPQGAAAADTNGTQPKQNGNGLTFSVPAAYLTPYGGTNSRIAYLDANGSVTLNMKLGQYGATWNAKGEASFMNNDEYGRVKAMYLTAASKEAVYNAAKQPKTPEGIGAGAALNSFYFAGVVEATATDASAANTYGTVWFEELARQYQYRIEKDRSVLAMKMVSNGVAYNFSYPVVFRPVDRVVANTVSLSETAITLTVGETKTLTATINNYGAITTSLPLNWTSNDTKVATIGGMTTADNRMNVTVKGESVGQTYVRAYLNTDNKEAICTVNVVEAAPVVVEPEAPETITYKVICRALNVRTGAGTSNAKVGLLKRGDEVEVLEVNNDWARILFQGNESYACVGNGKYLQPK